MPVYERGYKHWEHSGRRSAPPWWVIARRGILDPLQGRRFLFFLVLGWIPAIVKGGILYFTYKAGDLLRLLGNTWVDIEPPGFFVFLEYQRFFMAILLAVVGTRLIARDRRDNGLALYFARPLTLVDYVLGKLIIVVFYYFMATLFPVIAVSIFGYLVTSGETGLQMLVLIPLRATAFCTVTGVSMGLVLLALSSLGTRAVFVTVAWIILMLGLGPLSQLLSLLGPDWLAVIDFHHQYFNAGAWLFGAETDGDVQPVVSGIVTLGYTLAAIVVLRRRIRPVEVVS